MTCWLSWRVTLRLSRSCVPKRSVYICAVGMFVRELESRPREPHSPRHPRFSLKISLQNRTVPDGCGILSKRATRVPH
jgi:hypothetical protein